MPLNSAYYTVSIAAAGLGGSAPADGFIDNRTVEHAAPLGYGTLPASLANSLAKERANMRYLAIVNALQMMSNCAITNQTSTGGSRDAAPTPFAFTAFFERDEYVTTLALAGEASAGSTLTGANAVARVVARALNANYTMNRGVYDPTTSGTPAVARVGTTIVAVTADKLHATLATIEANITVTKLTAAP